MAGIIGEGRYFARTDWTVLQAVLATIAIIVVSTVVVAVAAMVAPEILASLAGLPQSGPTTPSGSQQAEAQTTLVMMLCAQLVIVLATLWAASRQGQRGYRLSQVLALHRVGPRFVGLALAQLVVFLGVYNGAIQLIDPGAWYRDLAQFEPFVRSSSVWLFALIVGVGAPLSEELLFRGFLLPALAQTRIGFAGAAIVTSAGWTSLHWGYSLSGLLEVFLIGLFLSAVLWRSGSLWATILCHGIYNLLLVALLRWMLVAA